MVKNWKSEEVMPESKKCATCKGSGSVPFRKPDDTISQYAQTACPDCGGYSHERSYADARMPDRIPSDYDFPCSDTWRAFYNGERQVYEPDQQASTPKEAATDALNDRRWQSVQQLRAQVQFLSKKVTEKRVEKEHPLPPKKQGINI